MVNHVPEAFLIVMNVFKGQMEIFLKQLLRMISGKPE